MDLPILSRPRRGAYLATTKAEQKAAAKEEKAIAQQQLAIEPAVQSAAPPLEPEATPEEPPFWARLAHKGPFSASQRRNRNKQNSSSSSGYTQIRGATPAIMDTGASYTVVTPEALAQASKARAQYSVDIEEDPPGLESASMH